MLVVLSLLLLFGVVLFVACCLLSVVCGCFVGSRYCVVLLLLTVSCFLLLCVVGCVLCVCCVS